MPERDVPQDGVADLRPVEQQEEEGIEKEQELRNECDGALRRVRERAGQEPAQRVDHVSHAHEDLVAILGDALEPGDSLDLLLEIRAVADEPFDHRPHVLGHAHRLVHDEPEHEQQRRNHQHERAQNRHRRRQCPAAKPGDEVFVRRVEQTGKDRGHQDGHQERPQHHQKDGADAGDQQQQEGLADSIPGHGLVWYGWTWL